MGNKPTRPVSIQQIVAILASTLALFFMVAFATKSVEAYRLRAWETSLEEDIAEMRRVKQELEAEIERRNSQAWAAQVLRDGGMLPEDVVSVVVQVATPVPAAEEPALEVLVVPTPPPVGDTLFDNAHWYAWERLIRGFD